ncbi:MAG: hypothetical protein ACO2OX_02075 [Candidatus Nanopusillus sp.]
MRRILYKVANLQLEEFQQEMKSFLSELGEDLFNPQGNIGRAIQEIKNKPENELSDEEKKVLKLLDKLHELHQKGDQKSKQEWQQYGNILQKIYMNFTEHPDEKVRNEAIEKLNKAEEVVMQKIKEYFGISEKKEKKWTSELPGYLITGGVGGVSGVAGAFLRKKLPTWAAISIIPATVIPTAFLTEYTLPEGYKPQKISDMFKKEYLKERGGHLVGKTLVGLLSGLATYGLIRKFTK